MTRCVVVAALLCLAAAAATPAAAAINTSRHPVPSGGFPADSVELDIHVLVPTSVEPVFEQVNSELSRLCPGNQVNLTSPAAPHITLYLTHFPKNATTALAQRLLNISSVFPCECTIQTDVVDVQGAYALWFTQTPVCLQALADVVTAATMDLAVPNQPIPGWVHYLPPAERAVKTTMVKLFGSPNVFSQFQPHVTVGFDDVKGENMTECVQKVTFPTTMIPVQSIAMSLTGPDGTVLRNGTIVSIPVCPSANRKQ